MDRSIYRKVVNPWKVIDFVKSFMALIDYGALALNNHRLFGSKALNKGSCLRYSNHDKISIIATLKGIQFITPFVEFN